MPNFDIAIAGEVNLDLILYGLTDPMPVERELLATNFELTLGSSSAILAHNMAVLGSRVAFQTLAGDDEMGRVAMERLAESQVDLSRCRMGAPGSKTGVTIALPHGATRHLLTYPGLMFAMTTADLDLDYLASARHFHLSSLFLQKGLHPGLVELFQELKRRGLTLSLDTNDDPEDRWDGILYELLPLIDLLLPNEDELLKITRRPTVETALASLAETVPLVVVKCGRKGAIVQQGSQQTHVAPLTVEPVDTIGAGDSFNAGFLTAWLKGASPAEAASAGNITGALSTQRPGGTEAFRDRALTQSFLKKYGFPGQNEEPRA